MISAKGKFRLDFGSEGEACAIYRAIKPETRAGPLDRASVNLHLMNNMLSLDIWAMDTASFRSCVNTYSRWMGMAKSLTEV